MSLKISEATALNKFFKSTSEESLVSISTFTISVIFSVIVYYCSRKKSFSVLTNSYNLKKSSLKTASCAFLSSFSF